jgi:integrase
MMPRQATGHIEPRKLADGTYAFHIRVRHCGKRIPVTLHERKGCDCGCGGGWDASTAKTEMGNMLARIRAGVWVRPQPPATLMAAAADDAIPTYDEYANWCLQAKIDGVISEKPIAENTEKKDRWRFRYSEDFFAGVPIDEIDRARSLKFKAHLLAESREQQKAIEAGADLRDCNGRRIVPLSLASIKMILDAFASILEEAIEDDYREGNPARTKRMHIEVPKPKRTFLEMDELACLLEAARDQDVAIPNLADLAFEEGTSAEKVARLAALGKRPQQIAVEASLAKSTVTHHLRRLGINLGRGYAGRRVVSELLGRAGLRASEVCDLKIGHVRLHDPEGTRLRIEDAKTEAGERDVEVTPDLAEVLIEHIDRLRRAGLPTGPNDYLVPNARGKRISRQRVRKIVQAAAKLANKRLEAKGLPPLPHTTPHTLRRTYISIALLANEFDVKWVMRQVGHADSKMTMEVYAQLQHRAERDHGESFDRLVRKAKKRLAGIAIAA